MSWAPGMVLTLALWSWADDRAFVHNLQRFPSAAVAYQFMEFNREYHRWLEIQTAGYPSQGDRIRAVLGDNERRYEIWTCVAQMQSYDNIHWKREAQQRLVELIGEGAWYAAELPSHVPAEAFQQAGPSTQGTPLRDIWRGKTSSR